MPDRKDGDVGAILDSIRRVVASELRAKVIAPHVRKPPPAEGRRAATGGGHGKYSYATWMKSERHDGREFDSPLLLTSAMRVAGPDLEWRDDASSEGVMVLTGDMKVEGDDSPPESSAAAQASEDSSETPPSGTIH